MQQLIKAVAVAAVIITSLTAVCQAADDPPYDFYRANEFSLDAFGTGSIGQQTINNISGSRVSSDVRLGAGVGVNYFFTRYVGVGGEVSSESLRHSFIDSSSIHVIGRLPVGSSGFAPYGFGGIGYQYDRIEQCFGYVGAGIELRFHQNWGIFLDARYAFADKSENFGVGRVGVRWSF